VLQFQSNRYTEWRRQNGVALELRDEAEDPPERLLQAVWFHQRLQRDRLCTADGRTVRVLHPGFWNREAGPDFRKAVIQFPGESPREGDVEIDVRGSDWRAHHHDTNPSFRNVVLHVVWDGEELDDRPTLALKTTLDSSLTDLAHWLGTETSTSFPAELLGQCCAPLRQLTAGQLDELLREAAFLRFQSKAAHMQARARDAGWAQALWEGVFRALGYKQNLWPMQRLGELRLRVSPETHCREVVSLQARLLGIGGLLPEELTRSRTASDRYLRLLWDSWWREREQFQDCALPRSLWKFSGLRPANHPQRRLALAAHWLARDDLPARLEKWCTHSGAPRDAVAALSETLDIPKDEFWSRHWTLKSQRFDWEQPLLGGARITDLAVNVVLPWLWARAVEGKNEALRMELELRYFTWPAAEDNSVLKLARQRLLGGASSRSIRGAVGQQGLLQIIRDYCEHSNALCSKCRFPELVRQWPPGLPVE
jgi:hypothetical protein